VDAVFQCTDIALPPAVILDYMYGVAAYKYWGTIQGCSVVESYYLEHYAPIPAPPRWSSSDNDSNPPSGESDNPNKKPRRRHHMSARYGESLAETMDRVNWVLLLIHYKITPEEAARRMEEVEQEEQLKAQEASRSKVMDWMNSADADGS